jgi:Holliday junction resolvase RusA-like endonuclease
MKNSKRIATVGRGRHAKTRIIKSEAALSYSADVLKQVGFLDCLLAGPLRFTAFIQYATKRKDLDASLLIDLLQHRVYENDNQIVEIHLHRVDIPKGQCPYADVVVEELNHPLGI